jgi:hypothetical protein
MKNPNALDYLDPENTAVLIYSFDLTRPCSDNPHTQFMHEYPDKIKITSQIVCSHSSGEASSEPLTVCQILRNLQLYRGTTVEVQGYWDGRSLEDECEMELKTGNRTWPNAILLDSGAAYGFGPGPVIATAKGKLEVFELFDGQPVGFGHLGYFPAQITVKVIKDIVGPKATKYDPPQTYIYLDD